MNCRLLEKGPMLVLLLLYILFMLGVGVASGQGSASGFDLIAIPEKFTGIAQDRNGAIWFSGHYLYLYDGYTFKRMDATGDSLDLRLSWARRRLTGGRHGVLCMSGNGEELLLYYIQRNTSAECRIPNLAGDDWSSARITCVMEASNGFFWFGTEGGTVFALNPHDRSFRTQVTTSRAPVRALCEDRQGRIWGATGKCLFLVQTPQIAASDSRSTVRARKLLEADIAGIACGRDGRLWLCFNDGRFGWMDGATLRLTFCVPLPVVGFRRQISSTSVDSAGNIWIAGGGSGLLRWDPSQGSWEEHFVSRSVPAEPVGETLIAIMVDRTGIVWAVGDSFAGVGRYVPEKEVFRSFTTQAGPVPAPQGNTVLSARMDRQGTLWLGTQSGGLEYRPRGSSSFRLVRHAPRGRGTYSQNMAVCIYERRNGDLWIGTLDGINVLDGKSLTFTPIRRHQSGDAPAGSDTVTTIFEDSRGQVWIGHGAGLDEYDDQRGEFRSIIRWPPESVGKTGTVACILEDRRRNLWVATAGRGVMRFSLQSEDTVWYRHDPRAVGGIQGNTVESLYEDLEGRIWLGTEFGLVEYDYSSNRFTTHPIFMWRTDLQSGMRSLTSVRVSAGIIPDGRGNFWFSTAAGGLVRFEISTGKQRAFATEEGVVVTKGSRNAFFRAADGTIFCGGEGGMTWFHPDRVRDSGIPPKIIISGVSVFGEPLPLRVHAIPELRLDPWRNTLTFEFSALDYGAPGRNQFEYMLDGANPRWVHTERSRSVTFAYLDPGDYLLRVRGSGREGVWSTEDCIVRFTILPPWWRTWWAYGGYGLFFLALIYGGYRLRLKQVRLKHQAELEHFQAEHLEEIDRLKSRFFANISHEFRTPLSLILGPAETIALVGSAGAVKENAGMITRNARRLLHLVNQLLDLSKFEAGQMKLKVRQADLSEIISGIASEFESTAARRNIRYTVGRPAGPIPGWCDTDAVEKIVTNLLSNAFKYTKNGGTVAIAAAVTAPGSAEPGYRRVSISVTDSGVGIPANLQEKIFDRFYQVDDSHTREHEGVGIGLALTKELVEMHRGSISVQSTVGVGSTFTVQLPVDRDRYTSEEVSGGDHLRSGAAAGAPGPETWRQAERTPDTGEPEMGVQLPPVADVESEMPEEKESHLPLVLIVEDNADMRRYIGTHLSGSFISVMAEDGLQGFARAVKIIPDLIISDVMMPKLDGFELCRRLKQDERTSHIPIILLTAKADTAHRIEGLETGADDYLTKPFEMEVLAVKVRSLIEQRRKLRERYRSTVIIKPSELAVTPADEKFLARAIGVVERHMAESGFDTEVMAEELAMSRMQLYRKVRGLTGDAPSHFIRSLRLQRAAELLQKKAGNVSEIGYEIGFNNPSHFARAFRERFGVSPSDYADAKVQQGKPTAPPS